ncbi:unnamed protein product, partial [Choristocarpus tenellus]
MERKLRGITRCLGQAVKELERVSSSEKAVREASALWMERFHAKMQVPDNLSLVETMSFISGTSGDVARINVVNGKDDRWEFLESKWLLLLKALYSILDELRRSEEMVHEVERCTGESHLRPGTTTPELRWVIRHHNSSVRHPIRVSQGHPQAPRGLLSLRDYTVIHVALDIVVCWGIAPLLQNGVGAFEVAQRPRSKAVKVDRKLLLWGADYHQRRFGKGRHSTDNSHRDGDIDAKISEVEKLRQLSLCADAVQGVVMSDQFMPMLLPHYLPDILAARLQLAFGTTVSNPLKPKGGTVPQRVTQELCFAQATAVNDLALPASTCSQDAAKVALQGITKKVTPQLVMGALRHLLSRGKMAPAWLRREAGRILSEIVIQPGGVQATLEVYLGSTGAGGGEEDTRAGVRVARVLAAAPRSVPQKVYVTKVSPQLVEMLHYDGQQRITITRVVVVIIGRFAESMPQNTMDLILLPLLQPLMVFWGPMGLPPTDPRPSEGRQQDMSTVISSFPGAHSGEEGWTEVVEEATLGRCLEDLEKLLTAAPPPPSMLGLFSRMRVTVPLFCLYCFCKRSNSHILKSVEMSLLVLISSSSAPSDLLQSLLPLRTGWEEDEVDFFLGASGGVTLRVKNRIGKGFSRTEGASPSDKSLLGVETLLRGTGQAEETLQLVGDVVPGLGSNRNAEAGGSTGGSLVKELAALEEAEWRARCLADMLEKLGNESSLAGKV